jgi:hypothetical protein
VPVTKENCITIIENTNLVLVTAPEINRVLGPALILAAGGGG